MRKKLKSKLTPLVESLGDFESCVVIKLKPHAGLELVRMGYFSGTEQQLRVYKPRCSASADTEVNAIYFDTWYSTGYIPGQYLHKDKSSVGGSICCRAIIGCLEDFGVSLQASVEPKGPNVPNPWDGDATKASIRVGGMFQINVEHLVDRATFKIECMACDQANYPGAQTICLTHHALGLRFPIPDELPGISVGPFKAADELLEDSRRG